MNLIILAALDLIILIYLLADIRAHLVVQWFKYSDIFSITLGLHYIFVIFICTSSIEGIFLLSLLFSYWFGCCFQIASTFGE
jgi:hypothetical protein